MQSVGGERVAVHVALTCRGECVALKRSRGECAEVSVCGEFAVSVCAVTMGAGAWGSAAPITSGWKLREVSETCVSRFPPAREPPPRSTHRAEKDSGHNMVRSLADALLKQVQQRVSLTIVPSSSMTGLAYSLSESDDSTTETLENAMASPAYAG